MKFRLVENMFPTIDEMYFGSDEVLQAVRELLSIRDSFDLFEGRTNTNYIKKDLAGRFISAGRVDSRGVQVNTIKDIAQYVKIFRDSRFETFRIFYIKDNKVVDYADVYTQLVNKSTFVKNYKSSDDNEAQYRSWVFYDTKMRKCNADGYIICHNHPSGTLQFSREDVDIANLFNENINGYLGQLIIGKDGCAFMDKYGAVSTYDYEDFKKNTSIPHISMLSDVFNLAQEHISKDTSIIFYCNNQQEVTDIQEIKNTEFSDPNIFKYLQNQKKDNGCVNMYIYTQDINVVQYCCQAISRKVIEDICYLDEEACLAYSARQLIQQPLDDKNPLSKSTVKTNLYKESYEKYYLM